MRTLLAGLVFAAMCAFAGDVTGTWSGSAEASKDDGSSSVEMVRFRLKQDGAKVTGTVGGGEESFEIANGKIDGSDITFEIVAGERLFRFAMKLEGDKLSGTASRDPGNQGQTEVRGAKISLTREK